MDELMQRDEDTLVQQRLHSDRLRRGSTVVEASGDEQRDPDVEVVGSGLPSGSGGEAPRDEGAREPTRTGTEAANSSGETPAWVRRTHANGARRCRNETRIEKISRITN